MSSDYRLRVVTASFSFWEKKSIISFAVFTCIQEGVVRLETSLTEEDVRPREERQVRDLGITLLLIHPGENYLLSSLEDQRPQTLISAFCLFGPKY